jgi:hypothetical protein
MLDADGSRQLGDKAAEEGEAAYVIQPAAAVKLVRDGDLVDGLVALP